MKSIKTKIALLMMVCTVATALIVGGLSIRNVRKQIKEDSSQIMNQACKNSSQEIDSVIFRIEQSVEMLADCVVNSLDDLSAFQSDDDYVGTFTASIENTLIAAANNTDGAVTAYLRYNPEFTDPTSGLFYSRSSSGGSFDKLVPTDFSIYDKSDSAHVGWYYIPVENKKATWMAPYLNENLQVYMVSYVVPLYKDGVSVGVVGMDIDFSLFQSVVDETRIYDTGYAFLVDSDNRIMYHQTLPLNEKIDDINEDGKLDGLCEALKTDNTQDELISYEYEGMAKEMVHQKLRNDMRFILTAPLSEINANADRLFRQIAGSTFVTVAVAILLAILIIRGIVKPVEELNKAARKIAEGDLDVTVNSKSKDEVGALAESISLTVMRLKKYIDYIAEISDVLEEIARGNLVFELHYDYEGEFARVKEALLHISQSLNQTLWEIKRASGQVTSSSGQVASQSLALSQGATHQASSIEELSASLQDIVGAVNRNAQNAQEAYVLTQEAGVSIQESNQNMADMTLAMRHIAETSNKISQIVRTVEDIASQTNILALNAAVESARAGEAGKSFAVVADEVRTLAVKVGAATKDIALLVEQAIAAIGDGNEIVEKTGNSLKAVVDRSSVIEAKIQEIAAASERQANSLEEVDKGVEQISAVVTSNSATAEEGAAASEEMSGQAQKLRDLIKRFRLKED